MDDITYWKNLASMAYRRLIEQNNGIAAAVIKNGTMDVWFDNNENWNGGIDYWTIVFILKYDDYIAIENQRPQIEEELTSILSSFHNSGKRLAHTIDYSISVFFITNRLMNDYELLIGVGFHRRQTVHLPSCRHFSKLISHLENRFSIYFLISRIAGEASSFTSTLRDFITR